MSPVGIAHSPVGAKLEESVPHLDVFPRIRVGFEFGLGSSLGVLEFGLGRVEVKVRYIASSLRQGTCARYYSLCVDPCGVFHRSSIS